MLGDFEDFCDREWLKIASTWAPMKVIPFEEYLEHIEKPK
jgi:hypothetical protein